ncbi:lef-12 [Cryptophlebia peltastica nucleopolyhedrovirus]|uniref:Lef-12 n=1 Tax=Cryptophlebia peltastica nucleopolyhedrovirus TaxID=2304025 RepID=A0A346RNQ0_9ABAC|nr:lef-12 [Cryptophlebia peltastica nucleopolyhedrovirus]AXS67697.1 lef-12 [Cryptophlebia peltastica nucleopolyhedrovirus]
MPKLGSTVTIIDRCAFEERLNHVKFFVQLMNVVICEMIASHEITKAEGASLCLADDTAAWICGRISDCNFVTFRVKSLSFNKIQSKILKKKYNFEETYEQQLLGNEWQYLIYINRTFKQVAIKLIVVREDVPMIYSNPYIKLSYFIKLQDLNVSTLDCDCGNDNDDLQWCNEMDHYHRSLAVQADLCEDNHNENIISLVCFCKNKVYY